MNTRPSASNKTRAAILILGLGVFLHGCAGDTTGGSNPSCDVYGKCDMEGFECNPKTYACEPVCQQASCQANQECVSYFGACLPVECGRIVKCANAGDFCDLDAHVCYPTSGKCNYSSDCPRFDGRVASATTVACVQGFCQIDSAPPLSLATHASPGVAVAVQSPSFGAQVASADALQFRWDGILGATAIALVLTDLPQDLSHVLDTAIWGRVLPADAEPVALWQDGVAIQKGVWLDSSAALPSRSLYFVVQAVRTGKLVGISALVPFRVGSPWPALYSPCNDSEVLPGSCANPNQPQICWGDRCRLLCASHLDCQADVGTACQTPSDGVRICG